MRGAIKSLWQHNRLLFIAFCVALLVTLFLAVRTVAFYAYWSSHRSVPVEEWMTIGYVARSWEVPPQELRGLLDLSVENHDRRSIAQIAREREVPATALVREVEQAVETLRAEGGETAQ
ncbi:hypothetical protein [Nitratireductor sp. OM-1]|uniref:hypothetical protein n=1 Tax=Nitratireductor sp. OM-1 TaxID=1756988 RepID=UPI000DE1621A|nr:hypothetical protein [Nitratireductor sp. OM-1]